jgi:hypothetical protein
MVKLGGSYLVGFDPNDTGEPFGFLRVARGGPEQWWLVQVWASDGPDEDVMVTFLNPSGPPVDDPVPADEFTGCAWYPIPWISDEIPRRFLPEYRVTIDAPDGRRIVHEGGADCLGEIMSLAGRVHERA